MCVKNGIVMAPLGGDGEGDKIGRSRRVLLVISHPDDESMFFTPLLSTLKSNEVDAYILCLSNGELSHHTGRLIVFAIV
jgi:LmbE family N-acetylglucosaminyl deacetylase